LRSDRTKLYLRLRTVRLLKQSNACIFFQAINFFIANQLAKQLENYYLQVSVIGIKVPSDISEVQVRATGNLLSSGN